MAVIYISSTYEDLKKEREAAAQAVRRLGHRTIAMEDYVASDKRPLDKCLDDVRTSDAYVGIFAWRYGFIPDGFDKSITHLEYEAAKEAGIPCLIFLLDETADWQVKYVSTGEEREKIDELRKELEIEKTRNTFKNADELSGLVSPAVSNLKLPKEMPSKAPVGKPKLGPLVSKMCDRISQVNAFKRFFQEKSEKCPKRPQFYFIHGDEWECHESLLERLLRTFLKEYAEKKWGENDTAIYSKEVAWPREGNLSKRKRDLKMNLINQFGEDYDGTDINANVLSRLPCFDKRPLVLIKHNIYSSTWEKETEQLIHWYIKDYWAGLECDINHEIPLFLVFFKIRYQKSKEISLKQKIFVWKTDTEERIRKQLLRLSQSSDEKCPCKHLDELPKIQSEDVLDWFDKHNIFEHEWERKEAIDSIFVEDNRPVKYKCMAEIEKELLTIINKYHQEAAT